MIRPGQRVRVHYNLQRGDFSVVDPRSGLVLTNVERITLRDVEFRVGEKMRQWSIANHRRKVMAYGVGIVVDVNAPHQLDKLVKVTYNPFRAGHFHVSGASETPVWRAPLVHFANAYCWTEDSA